MSASKVKLILQAIRPATLLMGAAPGDAWLKYWLYVKLQGSRSSQL